MKYGLLWFLWITVPCAASECILKDKYPRLEEIKRFCPDACLNDAIQRCLMGYADELSPKCREHYEEQQLSHIGASSAARILPEAASLPARAFTPPKINWVGGEDPMTGTVQKTEFAFQESNKQAGSIVLVPDRDLSSHDGALFIKRDQNLSPIPGPWEHDRIRNLGLVQITPGSDSFVIHFYTPINHEAKNEYLVFFNPKTGLLIWRRYENYCEKQARPFRNPTTIFDQNLLKPANCWIT